MRRPGAAAACAAAALLLTAPAASAGPMLEVLGSADEVLARLPLVRDGAFCLAWRHSVTGGAVADCFAVGAGGTLTLERSFLHDFAAGLGHLPGRGRQRAAEGGGYWIEGIGERLAGDRVVLRVGPPAVGHALTAGDRRIDLSALAAGRRVTLMPVAANAAPTAAP